MLALLQIVAALSPPIVSSRLHSVRLPAVVASRRDACLLGAAGVLGLAPSRAFAESPLTPSQMLTVGGYLNDLSDAKKALKAEITPLLELKEQRGYEAARITLRKPPINGIRKACSKVVKLLEENGSKKVAAEKDALYSSIKIGLADLDNGCKEAVALEKNPDLLVALTKLEDNLEAFGQGLGVVSNSAVSEAAAEPVAVAAE